MNSDDHREHEHHKRDDFEKEHHRPPIRLLLLSLRWKQPHVPSPLQRPMRDGKSDSPDLPEKIELVSDGTSSTPTVNVMRIITACTPYRSWSSNPSPGGSVWMYWLKNLSKTKMNAFAITSMNEY